MFEDIIFIQNEKNKELADKLASKGIKNLRITSVGNSIASGYSMVRTIKPLLLRNESLEEKMKKQGIDLDLHHFARAQNNNDEHVFEWLMANLTENEIHQYNQMDYSRVKNSMPSDGITQEEVNLFYPIDLESSMGFRDIVLESNPNLANILVYHGCTGSFLDNVTRNGKISQMLMYGVKRDLTSLSAILKFIQSSNRINGSNTQIYLCGAPNFLGLNISSLINRKLKKLADQYANVTYVDPVKSKFVYQKYSDGGYGVDIHYDEEEYLKLNNHIIESIIDNYQLNKSLIYVDRALYRYSKDIEMYPEKIESDKIEEQMVSFLSTVVSSNEDSVRFLKKTKLYLLEREPYDFFYLGKNNIKKVLTRVRNREKEIF